MLWHSPRAAKVHADFIVEVFPTLQALYTTRLPVRHFCNSPARLQPVKPCAQESAFCPICLTTPKEIRQTTP